MPIFQNKKILVGILSTLLVLTGVVVYKTAFSSGDKQVALSEEPSESESIEPLDPAIIVQATRSRSKDNTVVLYVSGMGGKVTSVAYELSYESLGLVKGVNSGSKPLEVAGKDSFEREVYLGTCSRNVCRPDLGVKSVSVVLEFTNVSGKKSQFAKDFEY